MSSQKRILESKHGVVLTEVSLMAGTPASVAAVAYSISSKRTPETWNAGTLTEAKRLFDEELAMCGGK